VPVDKGGEPACRQQGGQRADHEREQQPMPLTPEQGPPFHQADGDGDEEEGEMLCQ
jgi:hypothetical protein